VPDIGPLSWVKSEIDSSLERSLALLRAYDGDPSRRAELRTCRLHLHQASGAVQIVGLEGVARFLEEAEALVAGLEAGRIGNEPDALAALERAIAAIGRYLGELLEGAPDQPLKLFEDYRALARARGAREPFEAELYYPDLSPPAPPRPQPAPGRTKAEVGAILRAQRTVFQRAFLHWLRAPHDPAGAREMGGAVDAIEQAQGGGAARAFWWSAGALFDALAEGDLAPEPGLKALAGRIEQQMRRLAQGSDSVAERLFCEVLYWIARAGPASGRARQVKALYRLDGTLPERASQADITHRVPIAAALREAIAGAKEFWNKFAAGAETALSGFARQARIIAEQGRGLGNLALAALSAEIARAAAELQAQPGKMCEAVAMEGATALLVAESAAVNYQRLTAEFDRQANAMAARLAAALSGAPPQPAAGGPLIDEMTRRAQERLATVSALTEVQANLRSIEQVLDGYFRDPSRAAELASLDPLLHQLSGTLGLLGEDEAKGALERAAARIRGFARASARPALEDFEELAQILSGLGFYVDALRHGKADFAAAMRPIGAQPGAGAAPEAAGPAAPSVESELEAQKREAQALFEAWQASPGDAGLRSKLKKRLKKIRDDARLVADEALVDWARAALKQVRPEPSAGDAARLAERMASLTPQAEAPSAEAQRLKDASDARIDLELLAIFLEEAGGVVAGVAADLAESRAQPGSLPHLATIRRAFHTLKGSGRMVGLARLGDAAWAVEQVMNRWLQEERSATPELHALIEAARSTFDDWIARLKAGEPQPEAGALIAMAERLRRAEPPEVVTVGETSISSSLFAVFANEARQHLDALERETAALASSGEARDELVRAAHTLAGICGTVRLAPLHALGLALEKAASRLRGRAAAAHEVTLLGEAVAGLRAMYGRVLARQAPEAQPELAARLEALAPAAPAPLEVAEIPVERRGRRLDDELDAQLLPVFLEEAQELAPRVGELLRAWRADASHRDSGKALQRALHTLKGSARMAGAMGLGELLHHMESRIEHALQLDTVPAQLLDDLESSCDRMGGLIERLRSGEPAAGAPPAAGGRPARAVPVPAAQARAMLRVRADLLERLVNQAGEVAIARTRVEAEMRALKTALTDLTENAARLRHQLREIEIQAELQMQARVREAEGAAREFDPLEFDRFTRFQELTRFMAESVSDLGTVHHGIARAVDDADAALSAQARMTRELQQDLMRVRMVPIGSLAERLHRLARQVAKELGKRASLDLRGAQVELDRSVLERLSAPLEHLVRNAVTHGIEPAAARLAAGKPEIGEIRLDARQEGNEIVLAFSDDGAGLDLERIHAQGLAKGLVRPGETPDAARLAELVFLPGFSTAAQVTEIAGRGVGMDVVRSEVVALGGRIEHESAPGRGVKFTIRLPLTTAVTQAVLVRSGARVCALPAVMIEQVQHLRGAELERARAAREFAWGGRRYPLAYLPELLGEPGGTPGARRYQPVLLARSGTDAVALLVDEMIGNQEIVVKNLGPQLARVPGLAGITVLGSGEIVLILNPVPLARLPLPPQRAAEGRRPAPAPARPRVLVVDDSLTVRKITGRLLAREGYEVLVAKDGVEALERLAETVPDLMLVDIEMPRMDGFDLTRNVRADARLKRVPIVMITSRTADKHRKYALELGVEAFLGKPYQEDELLAHIGALIGR
jgi:chemosensory pili system protein ChpA (sensor histidine kinase/response regulator)